VKKEEPAPPRAEATLASQPAEAEADGGHDPAAGALASDASGDDASTRARVSKPRRTRRSVQKEEPAPPQAEAMPATQPAEAEPDGEPATAAGALAGAAVVADSFTVDDPAAVQPASATDEPLPDEAADLPWVRPIAPPAHLPAPPPQAWRSRHVVFIDVENTSREASINAVLDELDLDGLGTSTEIIAIGNWRVIGQGLARSLAARGAQLVHSAPATRVRDWSDLWIAVHAGIWRAGDLIELVSHDRAFDAVGDAASRLGVSFRRLTYGDGAPTQSRIATEQPVKAESGRRRRGGRGRGRGSGRAAESAASPAQAGAGDAPSDAASGMTESAALHPAPPDEIEVAIARLTSGDPSGGVTLDQLAEELKSAGFQRPAGSPRLITRLKRLKDVEVLADGRIRLASAAALAGASPSDATGADTPSPDPQGEDAEAEATEAAPARRSRRRGGRRRGGRSRQQSSDESPVADDAAGNAAAAESGEE
jgi:hypothetical protein